MQHCFGKLLEQLHDVVYWLPRHALIYGKVQLICTTQTRHVFSLDGHRCTVVQE